MLDATNQATDKAMVKQQLISGLLDAFTSAVSSALAETGPEDIRVNWTLTTDSQDDAESLWWSCGLSAPQGATFFIGAPEKAWEKLGRGGKSGNSREDASALVSNCFAKAVESHFGNRSSAQEAGPCDAPRSDWTRVAIEIRYTAGEWPPILCVLSPEFETALGGQESQPVAPASSPSPVSGRSKA